LEAELSGKRRVFSGSLLLVTVPLGVLKNHAHRLAFEPELTQKRGAIQGLEMGMVVKVNLLMRQRFWTFENFGFIHSDDEWLPTWWVDERGPMLIGWAGGPRAERLTRESRETIIAEAVRALSSIFSVPRSEVEDSLLASFMHDWNADPFSLGAYSFTPVGMTPMPHALAEPLADTLFFAGEATDCEGREGTVHGAIASGQRAAEQILTSLKKYGRLNRLAHSSAAR
jgi:monoamine oxidase